MNTRCLRYTASGQAKALGTNPCRPHWWYVPEHASNARPPARYEQQKFLHHRCRRAIAHYPRCNLCNLWIIHGSIACTHMGILHPPRGAYHPGTGRQRLCSGVDHLGAPPAIRRNCRSRYASAILMAAESALCCIWYCNRGVQPHLDAYHA